jgi:hypothetical protein
MFGAGSGRCTEWVLGVCGADMGMCIRSVSHDAHGSDQSQRVRPVQVVMSAHFGTAMWRTM